MTQVSITDFRNNLKKYSIIAQEQDLETVKLEDDKVYDAICALSSDMSGYEDALMVICAKNLAADHIVTRNLKDYKNSPVEAISPEGLIKKL